MNERIQELAKEAGYYLYDLTETHGIKTVETDSTNEWITLEKFAELLVRECAGIMYGRDENGNCKDGDTILEHFGVEE